jgi:hypothetical protein
MRTPSMRTRGDSAENTSPHAETTTRHRTPPAGTTLRGTPARGLQDNQRTSLYVLLALLAVAAITAGVVWAGLNTDSGSGLQPVVTSVDPDIDPGINPGINPDADPDESATTEASTTETGDPTESETDTTDSPTQPTSTEPAASTPTSEAPAPPTTALWSRAEIASVAAWDPYGDGSGENDELAPLALAGAQPEGGWPTLCYSSKYLGAKGGVGLIVTLSGPASGTMNYSVFHAPYWVEVFARPSTARPTAIEDWGTSLTGTQYSTTAANLSVVLPPGTQSVLIWVRELARESVCSRSNPYRGRIGNISFTSA